MVQRKTLTDLNSYEYLDKDFTANPSKYPQGYFKEKKCKNCNLVFTPQSPSNMYCSNNCKKINRSNKRYKDVYGISGQEALDMFNKQNGKCKICGGEGFKMHKNKKHGLSLDHDHETGKVRGWLCDNCNRGIGLLQDDISILEKAIEYLNTTRDEKSS